MRKRRTAEMQIREIMKSLLFCTVGFSYLDISSCSSFVFAVEKVQCWLKLAAPSTEHFYLNPSILQFVFSLNLDSYFYITQVRSLLCPVTPSVTPSFEFYLNCWICIELIHGFLLVVKWICHSDVFSMYWNWYFCVSVCILQLSKCWLRIKLASPSDEHFVPPPVSCSRTNLLPLPDKYQNKPQHFFHQENKPRLLIKKTLQGIMFNVTL